MPNEVNYKAKYLELRSKFMASIDAAWRDGFEHGAQNAQQQQAQQQQQQDHEQTMAALQPAQPGQPGQDGDPNVAPGEAPGPDSANPQGSELDQHIAKLESMLGQPELDKGEIMKAISDLKFNIEMKKSSEAIPAIARALHKPSFNLGRLAVHNMGDAAKKAVTLQHKIVSDVMKGFKEEETRAKKDIRNILSVEGLTKGE